MQVYFAPEDDPMDRLIEVVGRARERVRYLTFAFSHAGLAETYRGLPGRGVDVAGVTEAMYGTSYWEQSSQLDGVTGFDGRLDANSEKLHHKVVVVDGRLVATGSFNHSRRRGRPRRRPGRRRARGSRPSGSRRR